jgi:hypothetical protein
LKEWRKERREIKSLKRAIRQVDKKYAPLIASAKDGYEERIIDDYMEEVSPYQPKLDYLKSQRLIEKATKIGFEIPSDDDRWFIQQYDCYMERSYKVLSQVGEARLRNLIRKQNRENWEWWLKIITALTGLIGTIIGLVAILK